MKAKTIKTVKSLNVELTEEEFKGHAVELAKLMGERDRIESNLQSMRSQFKAQIDEATAKINRERSLVQTGREWRDVQCVMTLDYDTKRVITARQDTGEVVEDRGMYVSEMQVEMNFDGEGEGEGQDEGAEAGLDEFEPICIDRINLPRDMEEYAEMDVLMPKDESESPYELCFHSGKKSHKITFRNEREFCLPNTYRLVDAVYDRVAKRLNGQLDSVLHTYTEELRAASNNPIISLLECLSGKSPNEGEVLIAASRRLLTGLPFVDLNPMV